jgi:hypothetical protein
MRQNPRLIIRPLRPIRNPRLTIRPLPRQRRNPQRQWHRHPLPRLIRHPLCVIQVGRSQHHPSRWLSLDVVAVGHDRERIQAFDVG